MNKLETLENSLVEVINAVFKNGKKTQKQEVSDVSKLNLVIKPYIDAKKLENNATWTFSEIQSEIYRLAEYDPKNKDTKNRPFEMRVIRSVEQTILTMEKVNPNNYIGDTKNHDERLKTKNYKVAFNDKLGYRFDDEGNLKLPSISFLPITTQEVEGKNGKMKTEKFANLDKESLRTVSQDIASQHFVLAFPQTKKSRNSSGKREKTVYKECVAINKFMTKKLGVYKKFIESNGKLGNSECISETDAKTVMSLRDTLNLLLDTRTNAEELAYQLENGVDAEISEVA